jgi:hypothetical protein
MTPTADDLRRELARRVNDGIEVALFWSAPGDRVTIEIADRNLDETIEFDVPGAEALDAFYHPYAYATRHSRNAPFAIRPPVRV